MKKKRLINKNHRHLYRTFHYNESNNFKLTKIAILEGSSRSGKTISAVDFIIWYCSTRTDKTIFLFRQTYNSHKTTLYTDFHNRLKAFGLNSPFEKAREVSDFSINGNKLFFLGADKPDKFEGAGCDIAYFNELLDITQNIFDTIEQRCSEFLFGDYNPKFTVHWVYEKILKRKDCAYLHSIFLDNPFIPSQQRKKILSYEPTKENIEQGTADDYRWKVYGLGVRCAQEGLIFKNVSWIDSLPEVHNFSYGLDFGFTNDPTCLVKYCVIGKALYAQKLLYEPIEDSDLLSEYLHKIGISPNDIIIADSSDVGGSSVSGFVFDLRNNGYSVIKAKKPAGSIVEGIAKIKKFKLHLVKDKDVQSEQENYIYKKINDIATNQPIDAFNHFWDALRYGLQAHQEDMAVG